MDLSAIKNAIHSYPYSLSNREVFSGFLKDLFPNETANITVLLVAYDLGMADRAIVEKFTRKEALSIIFAMVEDYGFDDTKAEWAVKTWLEIFNVHLFDYNASIWRRFGGPEDDGFVNCTSCHSMVNLRSAFCPYCGVSLDRIKRLSSKSGSLLEYLCSLTDRELVDLSDELYSEIKGSSGLLPVASRDMSYVLPGVLLLFNYLQNIEKKLTQSDSETLCVLVGNYFLYGSIQMLKMGFKNVLLSGKYALSQDIEDAFLFLNSRFFSMFCEKEYVSSLVGSTEDSTQYAAAVLATMLQISTSERIESFKTVGLNFSRFLEN